MNMEKHNNGNSQLPITEHRHLLKRISSKLVIAVVVAVILPFFGLVYFIDSQIDTRLKENIVKQSLLSIAGELSGEINTMMRKRNTDIQIMSTDVLGDRAVTEYLREVQPLKIKGQAPQSKAWNSKALVKLFNDPDSDEMWSWQNYWRRHQTDMFNRYIRYRKVYDLILLIAPDGKLVTCNSINTDGALMGQPTISALFDRDFSKEKWFKEAMDGKVARINKHQSQLLPPNYQPAREDQAYNYHIGFAAPLKSYSRENTKTGVILTLVNWYHIQHIVDFPGIKAYFSGLVRDKEPSPYAWIWADNANLILAHKDRTLYGETITGSRVNLPQMVDDALSGPHGLYQEYSFRGIHKNAAYYHCRGPEAGDLNGGFGWIVGVGIDNTDIYAMSGQLRRLLYKSSAVVTLLVILWIMAVARRTTRPILALQRHMKNVSHGNLERKIHLDTGDEISDLAEAFNQMLHELKEKRAQLIKAEKDAAWQEMAQQISHDIKNTLTPIKLSVDLLKQSAKDHSLDNKENNQQILVQTLQLIDSQVGNLQKIAIDFYEFAGGRKPLQEKCHIAGTVKEVLALNRSWTQDSNIEVRGEEQLDSPGSQEIAVLGDGMKLHRVLTNIVSNAIQSMPDGGSLSVELYPHGQWAVLEIRDTGAGIPDDVRLHLFEPYFTTRSKGTGLGLAIAKRVIEDSGGTISLEPNLKDGNTGTMARVCLPLHK